MAILAGVQDDLADALVDFVKGRRQLKIEELCKNTNGELAGATCTDVLQRLEVSKTNGFCIKMMF